MIPLSNTAVERSLRSLRLALPDEADYAGSAAAIIRVQKTYRLTTDLMKASPSRTLKTGLPLPNRLTCMTPTAWYSSGCRALTTSLPRLTSSDRIHSRR